MAAPLLSLPLLSDAEVVGFLRRGYHIVQPNQMGVTAAHHAAITEQADRVAQRGEATKNGVLAGKTMPAGHGQNLFALDAIPDLDRVVRDPAVEGALTSLLGANYKLQVHRTNHYKFANGGDQQFHIDGQWRNLGQGWFRHYRRWHRPRKILCFYYPHDVITAPSAIVAGDYWRTQMTDDAKAAGEMSFVVPAGSFVLMHYSTWHRGTQETIGERRVMLKLLFDRTEEPAAPTWDHQQTPSFSEEILRDSPWVPQLYAWLAGAPPSPQRTGLTASQTDMLLHTLSHWEEVSSLALCRCL